ncbi:MAG TPA: hypothetical protein VNQ53_11845 [Nocardioides sp.]|nr:hypothetical protein [Nocardioides sp.]
MTRIEELVRDTMVERAADAPPPEPVIQRALAGDGGRSRRRVVTLAAFGASASIAAAACVGLLIDAQQDGDNPATPTATASATPGPDVAGDVRMVDIYAVAIERAVTEFVLGPQHPDVPKTVDVDGPVGEADRAALSEAVADVTALHWASEPLCVECGTPTRPAMLLRPIKDTDDAGQVEVNVVLMDLVAGNRHSFHSHLSSQVLEERDGAWQYVGPVPLGPPNPICDGVPAGEPRC